MSKRGYLEVVSGPRAGQVFALRGGRNVLGREEHCDVWIPDEGTSRRHAEIEVEGGATLRDLDSANGTRLNGKKVEQAVLATGDQIHIAQTVLCYRAGGRETVVIGDDRKLTAVTQISTTARPEEARPGEVPEKHLARLQSICRVTGELSNHDGLDELLGVAARALAAEIAFDRGAIDLDDQPLLAFDGTGKPRGRGFKLSRGVTDPVRASGQSVLFVAEEDHELAERRSIVSARTSSALCVPLLSHGDVIGLVYLDRSDAGRFGEDDLAFLTDLAGRIGPAARQALSGDDDGPQVIAIDPRSTALLETIDRVAPSDSPILLLGETGVGKEVYAGRVHRNSRRSGGPFIALNMAALPESLVEAELFGHEAGAFTGADRESPGMFRLAHGGTLFLDEVGELPLELQAKLLRVLETGEFFSVGGQAPVRVDVRIVAATNQTLADAVEAGRFRQDLYYRLAVVEVAIPPLRERPADIEPLAQYFVQRIARRLDRPAPGLSTAFTTALMRHAWPGNIRELRNVIERVLVLSAGAELALEDLPATVTDSDGARGGTELPLMSLKEAEHWAITRALEHTKGHKGEAARILGTTYPTLNKKIKEYGITLP